MDTALDLGAKKTIGPEAPLGIGKIVHSDACHSRFLDNQRAD